MLGEYLNNAVLKTWMSILLFSTFYFSSSIHSQTYTIKGTVSDKSEPTIRIPDVKIYLKSNPKNETRSNAKGEYSLTFDWKTTDTLVFKHTGYQQYIKVITPTTLKSNSSNTLTHSVLLSSNELDIFTFSVNKVDTVFGNAKVSVQDFVLLPNNRLLLLVYEKTFEKGSQLWLTDEHQQKIASFEIPYTSDRLFTDYAKNNYLIAKEGIFLINLRNEDINLSAVSKDDFYGFHNRILDTIGNNYYYSDYNTLYPAVNFYCTYRTDTTQHLLREVKDDFMMELYRAQYKYVSGRDKLWAYRKEQETGIDKEIWIGAQSFTQDLLYKPVYAPFFIIRDTVHIFDQYKSYLYRYNSNHEVMDSVFINYYLSNKGEKWEQPLLQDGNTETIYALFDRAGYNYIRQLNTQTGMLTASIKLSNRFVSNIRIENGYIFYIYRPYESQQKKFLYKEKL
jgi:hypothetical protein